MEVYIKTDFTHRYDDLEFETRYKYLSKPRYQKEWPNAYVSEEEDKKGKHILIKEKKNENDKIEIRSGDIVRIKTLDPIKEIIFNPITKHPVEKEWNEYVYMYSSNAGVVYYDIYREEHKEQIWKVEIISKCIKHINEKYKNIEDEFERANKIIEESKKLDINLLEDGDEVKFENCYWHGSYLYVYGKPSGNTYVYNNHTKGRLFSGDTIGDNIGCDKKENLGRDEHGIGHNGNFIIEIVKK